MSIKTLLRVRRGFSLLELLLVLSLAPIVFFTLYSNFSAGLRLWASVTRQTPEEDVQLFLYKIRRDLQNVMRSDTIPFHADETEIEFASGVQAPPELGGSRGIGQVRIFYDGSSKSVRREMRDYSRAYKETPGQESVLLQGVSSFALSYWTPGQTGGYEWTDSWVPQTGEWPPAVRVTFATERSPSVRQHIIYIPVGGKAS